MSITKLKDTTLIEEPKEYFERLQQYVKAILLQEANEEEANKLIEEMKKHVLNFMLYMAESHGSICEEECNYIAKTFDLNNIDTLIYGHLGTSVN